VSDVRIYLSFDVDHDRDLGTRFSEQSRRGDSGFTVSQRTEAAEITEEWCETVRRRIRGVDQVVIICGEHTSESVRMDSELRIAQEEGKPYFLLWGRRDRTCTMPPRVTRSGCMYSWTWEILQQQIAETLRSARPLEIPDHYKRP
jgi:hypothetical protein